MVNKTIVEVTFVYYLHLCKGKQSLISKQQVNCISNQEQKQKEVQNK